MVDLCTPALILSEVPVESVDIVECQHINKLLDEAHLEIVASAIEHRTTISEAWIVCDTSCWEGYVLSLLQWQ